MAIRYLLSFLLLSALSMPVFAAVEIEIDLSWSNATENVDGSPYTDNSVTTIYFGLASGVHNTELVEIPDPSLTTNSYTHAMTVPDNATVFVVMTHTDIAGDQSANSNEANFGPFAVGGLAPSPPGSGVGGSLSGTARIVGCPSGATCENLGN